MLCTLYKEQQSWNSIECTDQLAYLFHILYAFWSQLKVINTDDFYEDLLFNHL